MTESPALMVVLPVYNERESVTHVIEGWMTVLCESIRDFVILAIDDGSTDESTAILRGLREIHGSRLEILSRPNKGHGQSCLWENRYASNR